ncbi:hypothetical protein O0I10_012673, partial [Lichtheimia ornata]
HPIAFESKKLSPAERNYPAQERELLGILHALRSWRWFVEGRHYVVRTDHHPLQYFRSRTKPPPPRLIRWIAELELYDPEIQYKSGVSNVVPDLLSRRDGPNCHSNEASLEPEYLYALKSIEESDWPKFYVMEESKWPQAYKDLLLKHREKFVVRGDKVFRIMRKGGSTHEVRFALFARRADIRSSLCHGNLSSEINYLPIFPSAASYTTQTALFIFCFAFTPLALSLHRFNDSLPTSM